MDILSPALHLQAAPATRRLARQNVNLRSLVKNVRHDHAGATPDEVVALLTRVGVQAPGSWVAHWLRQPADAMASAWPRIASAVVRGPETKLTKDARNSEKPGKTTSACVRTSHAVESTPTDHKSTMVRDAASVLNRLVARTSCSLACYVQDARPWRGADDGRLWEIITRIANRHTAFAKRATDLMLARRWMLEKCHYPSQFTGYHDLAVRYVAEVLISEQRRLIQEMEAAQDALSGNHDALDLVREAAGEQRRLTTRLETALAPAIDVASEASKLERTTASVPRSASSAEHEALLPQTAA